MGKLLLRLLGLFGLFKTERTAPTEAKVLRTKSTKVIIWSHIANLFGAVSALGLMGLGVIEGSLAMGTLIASAIILVTIGVVGKIIDYYIRQKYEHNPKLDNQ